MICNLEKNQINFEFCLYSKFRLIHFKLRILVVLKSTRFLYTFKLIQKNQNF